MSLHRGQTRKALAINHRAAARQAPAVGTHMMRPASFSSGVSPQRAAPGAKSGNQMWGENVNGDYAKESLTMTIIITAFERSPDGGSGLARDTRVRWALEEVGQPYEVRPVSWAAMKEPAHLALHPFGQIPTYEEGDLALFETGSIVFHIAERHLGLLPDEADARARAIMWMFAALSTVEPAILELANARLLERDKPWSKARLPLVEDRVRDRLQRLSARLAGADWLDGGFSAGDLMMVSVLLRLKSSRILDEYPNLAAYVARGEARPAYKRAFDAQLKAYTGEPSTD
jgi:glutathione S-transferase